MRMTRTAAAVFSAALVGGAVWGGAAGASTQWTTYHADNSRSGVENSEPSLNPLSRAWSNSLDGASVYGQPVVAAGRVFVATEDDNVYALDAHDGHILWHRNIGQPLQDPSSSTKAGCGDIAPLGITSTPVVDTSRSTVYVVGEVSNGGNLPVGHQLVGFNIYTGAVTRSVSADPVLPAGENLVHLQQRAALAVANGRVYVGFGGLDGDCGTYHGWLVGVDEAGARPSVQFDVTPQSTGGAIWMGGGGPSVDAAGNLYVTTGNINAGPSAPWSESVLKLAPGLGTPPLAHFQDTHASDDEDLGTGDATLLPGGEV
ncbi:MAG TPA: PQQ-binding-like beta-propeller repeat protein, partial [Acidimicrobiales bacterium]